MTTQCSFQDNHEEKTGKCPFGECHVPTEMLEIWEGPCFINKNCFYALGDKELGDLIFRKGEDDKKIAKRKISQLNFSLRTKQII